MKDRIHKIMTYFGFSQQQFAQQLDLLPASISSIFNGRTNPTNNHVTAIHRAFPQINIAWLMFGEGDMFVEGYVETEKKDALSIAGTEQEVLASGGAVTELFTGAEEKSNFTAQSKENAVMGELLSTLKQVQAQQLQQVPRRIKEIRVFYDDGTYESFGALFGKQ